MRTLVKSSSLLFSGILVLLLVSCASKEHVQLIVKGGKIYSVDSLMSISSVMIIHEGKVVCTGDEKLLDRYTSDSVLDLRGLCVYPGFNDAHGHFLGLGLNALTVDLSGTTSWDEVLQKCSDFVREHHPRLLSGRGWDQNDWISQTYPTNEQLNLLFPDIPVLLKRVDGHAAMANFKALQLAGINLATTIDGGEIVILNKKLTGLLIDNAVDLVEDKLPKPDSLTIRDALLTAQRICFSYGITSATDAGLETELIEQIDALQKHRDLLIRLYVMINVSDKNLDHWLNKPPLFTERLNVSSFKMYADGALGSRGACLIEPYSDQTDHYGLLLTPTLKMESFVKRIAQSGYQLNTHCIGDSANRLILKLYASYLQQKNNRRWRIEHAQVIHPNDFHYFGEYGIIPSVQPVHATSDMYWAEKRIGKERLKGAYAYKTLLSQNGWIPLGTDFPVESPNPFHTFYAAVARKDNNQFPSAGFQIKDALSRTEALKGMTLWPAKAAFEEPIKGSLEPGKLADFIITDVDLMNTPLEKIRDASVKQTFVNGKCVFIKE